LTLKKGRRGGITATMPPAVFVVVVIILIKPLYRSYS
jgi:hypothetical protein